MAAHVWLVVATYRNGQVRRFKYHGGKAAGARAGALLEGRAATLNDARTAEIANTGEPWPLDIPAVTVTKSHPITWPHPAGDATTLDIPEPE